MTNKAQINAGVEAEHAYPALTEVAHIAAGDPTLRRVPVKRELMADAFTTIEAMRRVRAASNHCFLFESAEADRRWGRHSFLGFAPTVELTCVKSRAASPRSNAPMWSTPAMRFARFSPSTSRPGSRVSRPSRAASWATFPTTISSTPSRCCAARAWTARTSSTLTSCSSTA